MVTTSFGLTSITNKHNSKEQYQKNEQQCQQVHKTKKDDGNPVGSITWEIKKNSAVEASTSSEAEKIFQGENESLAPKIE